MCSTTRIQYNLHHSLARSTFLTLPHALGLSQLHTHTHNFNAHIHIYVIQVPGPSPSQPAHMFFIPHSFDIPDEDSDTDSSSDEAPTSAPERAGSDGLQPPPPPPSEQPSGSDAAATTSQPREPLPPAAGVVRVNTEVLRALTVSPFGRFWTLFGVCPWRHFAVAIVFIPLFTTAAFGYVVLS
ncbi:hypothetical protein NpPPO83_00011025 [Neofusicoccum parvum]|uniref:Uncharacterized protein n=1 Tax=Neofusicoccum parvum TaxID=310453 RepID=A0ACB5S5Y8_9PEZI|nr:hypothetical protein NpPPO83_00011025 [Neofusicoccum parvum]